MRRINLGRSIALCVVLSLAACGNDEVFQQGGGSLSGGGSGGAGGGQSPGDDIATNFRLGSFDNGVFVAGQVKVGQSPLAAGGSSGLTVNIVDIANNNAPLDQPATVTFSSACASGDNGALAVIDPVEVTTSTGVANATYRAQGCSGVDTVRASVSVDGSSLSASGDISVLPAELGSIEFVSASPEVIGIRGSGSGLPETSVVKFKVLNASGGGVANEEVQFTLNTSVGGIKLLPEDGLGVTDSTGSVSVTVQAGTVHTAVRITAAVDTDNGVIQSQSNLLAITTGFPDQNSFSLSAECSNIEALNYDGVTNAITIRAADRFNNPAPEGTSVAFTTEGGSIVGNCATVDGVCSVNWTSQNPRPLAFCDQNLNVDTAFDCEDDAESSVLSPNGALRAGRSTVLATAIGEESFVDSDGDGQFDVGESWGDLGEAFRDDDEDGVRDAGTDFSGLVDEFVDFDLDGRYDGADGLFNGLLCDETGSVSHCNPSSLSVRESLTIVMSASTPFIRRIDVTDGSGNILQNNSITLNSGGGDALVFVLRDGNYQPLAAQTQVSLVIDGDASVVGLSSYVVPCTSNDTAAANRYGFTIKADDLQPGAGDGSAVAQLLVTSPRGVQSIYTVSINVTAPAAP